MIGIHGSSRTKHLGTCILDPFAASYLPVYWLGCGLYRQREVQGMIGPGGSRGTTLGGGMRSFAVGVPKIMISTMASAP